MKKERAGPVKSEAPKEAHYWEYDHMYEGHESGSMPEKCSMCASLVAARAKA